MVVLNVLDFDQTITYEHTFNNPFNTPLDNTKENLKGTIKHSDTEILAIASYHNDPDFILGYLLHLLDMKKEHILKVEHIQYDEIKDIKTHQLDLIYFSGIQVPLIISTVHAHEHRRGGKNQALNDIKKRLPPCDKYRFYDDDMTNITEALKLGFYDCYHVDPKAKSFQAIQVMKAPSNSAMLFRSSQKILQNETPNNSHLHFM